MGEPKPLPDWLAARREMLKPSFEGFPMDGTSAVVSPFSGTLMAVLAPGNAATPWRGLVLSNDDGLPVCLALKNPPGDIQPGDDIHLHDVRRYRGDGDSRRFPDEVFGPDIWAASSSPGEGTVFQASLSQPVAQDASGLARKLGMATLASLATTAALDLRRSGDSLVLARGQASRDPAIAWAMRRFSDPGTDHLRPPVTIVLDPAALLPRDVRRGKCAWLSGIWSAFQQQQDDVAALTAQAELAARLNDILPALIGKKGRSKIAEDFSRSDAFYSATVGDFTAAGENNEQLGTVSLYSATETSDGLWRSFTGLRQMIAMPREFIPTEARNKLSAAHELAHGYSAGIGHLRDDVLGGECFADAVAIISYVTETGDLESARKHADMRSIGSLFGMHTHATGPACLAALEVAQRLHDEYGGSTVPLAVILQSADDIRQRTTHPNPSDLRAIAGYVRAVIQASDGSRDIFSIPHLSSEMEAYLTSDALDVLCPAETTAMVREALSALQRSAYDSMNLADPDTLQAAATVYEADLADTARHLRHTGLGAMVPEMLARSARSAVPETRASATPQPEAMTLLGAVLQTSRSAATRLLQKTANPYGLDDLRHSVGQAQRQRLRRASVHHAILAKPGSGPAFRFPVLSHSSSAPSGAGFDVPGPERLRQLQLAVHNMLDEAARSGSKSVREPAIAALGDLAWSIRVDTAAWGKVCQNSTLESRQLFEQVAQKAPGAYAILQYPAAQAMLADLVERTLTGRPVADAKPSQPPENPAWERLCQAKMRAAARMAELAQVMEPDTALAMSGGPRR